MYLIVLGLIYNCEIVLTSLLYHRQFVEYCNCFYYLLWTELQVILAAQFYRQKPGQVGFNQQYNPPSPNKRTFENILIVTYIYDYIILLHSLLDLMVENYVLIVSYLFGQWPSNIFGLNENALETTCYRLYECVRD